MAIEFMRLERAGRTRVACRLGRADVDVCRGLLARVLRNKRSAQDVIGEREEQQLRGIVGEYAAAAYYGVLEGRDWSGIGALADGGVDLEVKGRRLDVKSNPWSWRASSNLKLFVRASRGLKADGYLLTCVNAPPASRDGYEVELVGWCPPAEVESWPVKEYGYGIPCYAVPHDALIPVKWDTTLARDKPGGARTVGSTARPKIDRQRQAARQCDRCRRWEVLDKEIWAIFRRGPVCSAVVDGEKCGGRFPATVAEIGAASA